MNSVNLIGRLTKNVEVKMTTGANPVAVANFTIAVDKRLSKQEADQRKAAGQATADFINCVAWRQSAQYLGQYASQGTQVAVSGSLQTRSYQNQQGQTVYVTEVICDQVKILQNKNAQPQANYAPQQMPQAPVQQPVNQTPANSMAPQQMPAQPQPVYQQPQNQESQGVYLDISQQDLPFY
ncbi:MAG: single-stranded DNA-binding protein [Erysipelotrichaceae bacterium]|nr:single-stranded DNA-binding protein [Erysipelotrichaceae bacterium]